MENTKNTIPHSAKSDNDEIDLIALAKTLWDGRKAIIRYTVFGILLGLFIAIASPKEYSSSTIMVPQTGNSSSGNMGGLSSLAAMAGVNVNNLDGAETLSPMIYPQIINSVPFQLDLINSSYKLSGINEHVSLYTYYTEIEKAGFFGTLKKYTIGLPEILIKAIKGNGTETSNAYQFDTNNPLFSLSKEQEEIREKLDESISLEINEKEGYLNLTALAKKPELAAQLAHKAQSLLQEYITNFKLEKAQTQLNFIEKRYSEKKNEFVYSQERLARFRDKNKNMSSALARTEEERLQSEYNLAYSVYSELAKQLEQAKIQVKEETPVFSIIQPVQIPIKKSKPNRPLILIVWTFLGGIIGVGIILGKEFFGAIKGRWEGSAYQD